MRRERRPAVTEPEPEHIVTTAEHREGPRMHAPRAGSVWPDVILTCQTCGWASRVARPLAGAAVRAHLARVATAITGGPGRTA